MNDRGVPSMITQQRLVFVGGVPATGKTFFGRWLSCEHEFMHVELEDKRARNALGLAHSWRALREHGDASALIAAVERSGSSVIVDWGFPPAWLWAVKRFADAGAELWWFDGDRAKAREEFSVRTAIGLDFFDRQLAKIDRWWPDINATFGERQLHVLGARGERMRPEFIWLRMSKDQEASGHPRPATERQSPYLPKSMSG